MSDGASGTTLDSLAAQLAELTDLFRRRLLEDRARQATIEDLQARLERAERERAAETLRPLVTGVSLVTERIRATPPSAELNESIIEELDDILDSFGIRSFGLSEHIDRRRHEIASVTGEGPVLEPGELIRAGYEKDGVVLRAALITAIRSTSGESAGATNGSE